LVPLPVAHHRRADATGEPVVVGDLPAALAAEGKSECRGVEWVERGYEDFVARLSALGASIRKVD